MQSSIPQDSPCISTAEIAQIWSTMRKCRGRRMVLVVETFSWAVPLWMPDRGHAESKCDADGKRYM